jgi:pyruvate/2-oxoglutarate dehydrogenase complex dihydrolipoamide dehydrogenase (E3) component/uncharacterized membrane protein YdjX (TVP38/TMEM64 family)
MKNNNTARYLLVLVMASLIGAFFILDLGNYLTLDYLQQQREQLLAYYHNQPAFVISIYMLVYIAVTALSLPGATIMTLAGAGIFGLAAGTVIVSFASTIGATLAFLCSRFLLRDYVQSRFAGRMQKINEGIKKDGIFYLFTLRLIPVFPFFMINLVMGVTPIRIWQFFFVSQVGMLPGTLVYVNAGNQLASLESLAGILSPGLLFSFALLGLFPLLAKRIVAWVKARRYLKRFKKPSHFDYNVVVIGAGSGGLVSAYIAAAVKAKVALIERHKMGGDCLNTGCVPSKALIRSARILSYAGRAKSFGFNQTVVDFDFATVMERVQRVIHKIEPHDSTVRYTELGVECIIGEAKILSPYEIEVDGRVLTTRNIIVATGARPQVPRLPGLEGTEFHTSDSIWELRQQPRRLLVLGGGPIGCELAQCFQRLGSEVTLVQRPASILPREDTDISTLVSSRLQEEGMRVLTSHSARSIEQQGDERFLVCDHNGSEVRIPFDQLLIALGRKANVEGFGLEALEVSITPHGTIEADPFLRTNYPNIFVCGDVTGPYQFTHTAAHQAWYAAVNALFGTLKKFRVDYSVIPWATYTDPEVARVGLNELEAGERGIAYEVTTYGLDDLDRAIADEEDYGMVKVLTVPGKDTILGVTIAGSHAGDLIAEFVLAMKHGIGLNKVLGTIHIYPTLAEANKYVAGAWKKNHAPQTLLRWVERYHAWRRG